MPQAFPESTFDQQYVPVAEVHRFVDKVARLSAVDPAQAVEIADDFYYQHLEGFSPRDVLGIGTVGMLDVLATARNVPELQPLFCTSLVGGLAKEFSFAEKPFFDNLAERVVAMKPERAMLELTLYRDIAQAASGIAAESGLHSAQGIQSVTDRIVADSNQSELVRLFAQSLERSAIAAFENPASIMELTGNPRAGKFAADNEVQRLHSESSELTKKILSDADGGTTFLARLSSDAVGVVDRTGAPLEVATLTTNDEWRLPTHGIEASDFSELRHISEMSSEQFNLADTLELLERIQNNAPDGVSAPNLGMLMSGGSHDQSAIGQAFETYQAKQQDIATFQDDKLTRAQVEIAELTEETCRTILADERSVNYLRRNYPAEWQAMSDKLGQNRELGQELLVGLLHEVDADVLLLRTSDEEMLPDEARAIIDAKKQLWLTEISINREAREAGTIYRQATYGQAEYIAAVDVLNATTESLVDSQNWELFQSSVASAVDEALKSYAELDFKPLEAVITDKTDLFRIIHESYVRDTIEQTLGFDMSTISLGAQEQAIDYLLRIRGADFTSLKDQLDTITDVVAKAELFEAFTATEFGDDFGQILFDIFEENSTKALPVLRMIREVRASSQEIGAKFMSADALDQQLAVAVPVAFIKRTTELLALAKRDGIDAIVSSLQTVRDAALQVAEAITADSFQVVEATADYGTLRADNRPVTITARPAGDNARLGFTVRNLGEDKRQRLNIRLDYEDGELSLDIGSVAKVGVNSSEIARQVGNDLAKGELALASIRAEQAIKDGVQQQEISLHGNHVREAFKDITALQPEEFSGIVNRFLYRLRLADSKTPQIVDRTSER